MTNQLRAFLARYRDSSMWEILSDAGVASTGLLFDYRRYQPEFIGLSLMDIEKYLPNPQA